MKIYFRPTPVVSLKDYEDAHFNLYKTIKLIPIYDFKEDIVHYPLSKLENGRFMTYWKSNDLINKFINHEDDKTLGSVEDLLKKELELDELVKRIEHLETFITKFHFKFKSQHSVAMAKAYTYGYLYLQGKLDYNSQSEFRIESSMTNFNRLKKAVGFAEDKLVQNFHSLIMDLGCKSYHEYEKSVRLKFGKQQQVEEYDVQTFNLVDRDKFEDNSSKICAKLCELFVSPNTEYETIDQVFSGMDETITPIVWIKGANHLNYFLKGLKAENKITNGNYFKLAESIFVKPRGESFNNLKNSHSTPSYAMELDEVISLF